MLSEEAEMKSLFSRSTLGHEMRPIQAYFHESSEAVPFAAMMTGCWSRESCPWQTPDGSRND